MVTGNRIKTVFALVAVAITGFTFNVAAKDMPPDLDGKKEQFKHLVVYIYSYRDEHYSIR